MAPAPKKPAVKKSPLDKPAPAGFKSLGSSTTQKAKNFMKGSPNKITAPSKRQAGGVKMGAAAPKTGGTTPPKDNAKTKTFAKNAGVSTMKSTGANNATVTTKGGTTNLTTYYQGKNRLGENVIAPKEMFAGKTSAQVDSIASARYNVPKGGFKKVTTSQYNPTPKASTTAKTMKGTKVTAKKTR
jgi:hypothetical protein